MRKRLAAEFLGTFGIVFAPVALSATGAHAGGDPSLMAASWVSGLAVLVMIVIFGPFSGAHFNPAVSLGFAVAGKLPPKDVLPYLAAQFAGTLVASGAVAMLYGGGYGVHIPSNPSAYGSNIGTEILLTFWLMLTILGSIRHENFLVPPVAIGLVVVVNVWIGGPITGGSMNPARSFGPAVFGAGAIQHLWLYLLIPPIGAVLAALTFKLFEERRRLGTTTSAG